MISNQNNIIVPINLQALCIGNEDATKNCFIKQEADFSYLPYYDPKENKTFNADHPNLSEYILTNPFESDTTTLQKGIHLHWALPDALTHGVVEAETEEIQFPHVPDHWLITRIVLENDGNVSTRSWILESSALSKEDWENDIRKDQTTIPYTSDRSPKPYRWLGRVFDYEHWGKNSDVEYWDELSAVGFGQVHFAAFYPNCKSVFGFHDKADDLNEPGDYNLTYCISGWHGKKEHDPLQNFSQTPGTDFKQALFEQYQWQISDTNKPESTLYSGMVTGIDWNPKKSYLSTENNEIDIAFGSTQAEALAALLTKDQKNNAEKMLNLLQLGLVSELDQPEADLHLEQALHQNRFETHSGGWIWSIRSKEKDVEEDKATLPPGIATALDSLNQAQRAYDQTERLIRSLRWQIFVDWYKYMIRKYRNGNEETSSDKIQELITKEIDYLDQLKPEHEDIDALTTNICPDNRFELQKEAAPRYFQAKDPVVLLSSKKQEPWDYAGERNNTGEDNLRCRLSAEILTDGQTEIHGYLPEKDGIPETLYLLINEAVLFSHKTLEELKKKVPPGIFPESIALNKWEGTPWLPLYLQWNMEYKPLKKASDNNYDSEFIKNHFSFSENGTELIYQEDALESLDGQPYESRGAIFLTPSARVNIVEQIQKYLENNPDAMSSGFKDCLDTLSKMSVLSQSLDGFHETLIMRKKTLQLVVADPLEDPPNPDSFCAKRVREAVGSMNLSAPLPRHHYLPIRTGLVRLKRLRLVDAFGRFQELDCASTLYASTIKSSEKEGWAFLYPRLTQPCRLLFRFLYHNNAQVEMNAHPATNPICGWILPNFLDNSLMLYDATGAPVGSLWVSGEQVLWENAPGTQEQSIEEVLDECNEHLKNLALALATYHNGGVYVQAFIDSLNESLESIEPMHHRQTPQMASLIGRPLALVRASLILDLEGLPSPDESWDALKDDLTKDDVLHREHRNFINVQFPVRLGDHKHFDDGLLGYFLGDEQTDYTKFYTTCSESNNRTSTHNNIEDKHVIYLTPNPAAEAKIITMLMDPRAAVHAAMGILPVKAIQLPTDKYTAAIEAMRVTFLTAPILTTNPSEIALPVPSEEGWKWCWIARDKQEWITSDISPLKQEYPSATQKIKEGWLQLVKDVQNKEASQRDH